MNYVQNCVLYCFMPSAITAIVVKINNLFEERLIITLILINKIDKSTTETDKVIRVEQISETWIN